MSELRITWANLDHMFTAMGTVQEQADAIDAYFGREVCNTAGFDYERCVLKPISDQLIKLAGVFTDMRDVFDERWDGVRDSMVVSARHIDATDEAVSFDFDRYAEGAMGPFLPQDLPDVDVDIELFPLRRVELSAPEAGESQLDHNPKWEATAETFDGLRDTINEGIDRINSVGVVHVDRLTDKSLDELIIYPLSGDYLTIQGNAGACDQVDTAMADWASNFSRISGKTVAAFQGEVEVSLAVHLGLYHLVMRAIGEVIGAGSLVFDEIARVSEQIAVAVEDVLVTMAKVLLRVSTKIATRVLGWFGWAMLVKDLVERGIDAITDIVDDVLLCIEIIDACFELVDAIRAWAEECQARLRDIEQIVDLVSELPRAGGGGLGGLPPVDETVFGNDLVEIGVSTETDDAPGDELDDQLGDLQDAYPEESQSDGSDGDGDDGGGSDDDEGDVLMAPGAPEVPGYPGGSSGGTSSLPQV